MKGCGPVLAFSAIFSLTVPAAAAERRLVIFPGAIHSVSSPDGSGARIFYRPHMDRDGGQAHPVFYEDARGHYARVAKVTRSMGVSWSPDGRHVFLQDNWGSDVADCLVLSRIATSILGVSLFKIVQQTPGRPTGTEKPSASHYYVHCDQWQSVSRVEGAVSGHTDTNPSHDFDHRFTYDAQIKRIRWRR
jgi:hypothetical protein